MEKEAKSLGAKVGKSVTGKTNILVTGENVGATKMNDARAKGVKILTEEEYLAQLKG
jgi:DNA ligase (NAD+)